VDLLEIFTDAKELLTEAKALLGVLMSEDPVRRKYWLKREKEISKRLVSIEKKEDNAESSA
jgi:hypothetical protein